MPESESKKITGFSSFPGMALGKAYVVCDEFPSDEGVSEFSHLSNEERAGEYRRVLDDYKNSVGILAEKIRRNIGANEATIVLSRIIMLEDADYSGEIERLILEGMEISRAIYFVSDTIRANISALPEEYMRARADDVLDIRNGLLGALYGKKEADYSDVPEGSILILKNISVSTAATIDKERVKAIVVEEGSASSHSSIILSAMGIPTAFGVGESAGLISTGDTVFVDTTKTESELAVVRNDDDRRMYEVRIENYNALVARSKNDIRKKITTKDGRNIEICCNIGTAEDAGEALENGGDGIGLLRTEFLFSDRETPPTEDEQFECYKKILQIMKEYQVTIRTLDAGGDKPLSYIPIPKEDNPALGVRGIRLYRRFPDIYKTQLRALVRASAYGDLRIMIPMVTDIEEMDSVRSYISEVMRDFDRSGISYNRELKIGCMIETPAAAICAQELAEHADFFSIGTNDLVQYVMCADRNNSRVTSPRMIYNPAVTRLIKGVADAAAEKGIPVSVCGEAASDEDFIRILLSYGIESFSVSPGKCAVVKQMLSEISIAD